MKTSSNHPIPGLVTPARLLNDEVSQRVRHPRLQLRVRDATIFLFGLAAILIGGLCMFLVLSSL